MSKLSFFLHHLGSALHTSADELSFFSASQIQMTSLISAVETREKLMSLLMGGLVQLQEIPRSAERTAAKSFFLWKGEPKVAGKVVMEDALKSICNVRERLVHELEVGERLLGRSEETMTAAEKDYKARLWMILDRLFCAEAKLDELVMILKDF
jgi:DNA-directed RNA polymerase III subunit RPC3